MKIRLATFASRQGQLTAVRKTPQVPDLPDPFADGPLRPYLDQITSARPYYEIPGAPIGSDWIDLHRYQLINSDRSIERWRADRPPCEACAQRDPKVNYVVLLHKPTGTIMTCGSDCASRVMGRPLQRRTSERTAGAPRGAVKRRALSDLDKPMNFADGWRIYPILANKYVPRTQWMVLRSARRRVRGAPPPGQRAVLCAPTRLDAVRLLLYCAHAPGPRREAIANAYAMRLWLAIDPTWFDRLDFQNAPYSYRP